MCICVCLSFHGAIQFVFCAHQFICITIVLVKVNGWKEEDKPVLKSFVMKLRVLAKRCKYNSCDINLHNTAIFLMIKKEKRNYMSQIEQRHINGTIGKVFSRTHRVKEIEGEIQTYEKNQKQINNMREIRTALKKMKKDWGLGACHELLESLCSIEGYRASKQDIVLLFYGTTCLPI